MKMRSWLHQWIGRKSTGSARGNCRAEPKAARRANSARPCLEALEDRNLLTAPGPAIFQSFSGTASQFDTGATALSGTAFIGNDNLNVNAQLGGISNGFGAAADFSLSGKLGLQASYSVDPGTVTATY